MKGLVSGDSVNGELVLWCENSFEWTTLYIERAIVRTIVLLCHCVYAKEFQTWLLKRGFRMGLSCFNFGISKRKSSIELKSTYMPSHQMHARIQKYMIISVGLIARLINKEAKLAPNSEIIINHPRPKTVLYVYIINLKFFYWLFFFFLFLVFGWWWV